MWSISDIITGPLLGAVIGLVTNKIAVDMLFRPLNPVYIGKFHVPFTPGIIPKGKARFGKAVGEAVGNNLLTPSIIKVTLLSNETEAELIKQIDALWDNLASDHSSLASKMEALLGDKKVKNLETEINLVLTRRIQNGLLTMNLGAMIGGEITAAVKTKIQGTMMEMFLQPSILEPIEEEIQQRINQYVKEHGEEKISTLIREQYTCFMEQSTLSLLIQKFDSDKLKAMFLEIYRTLINNYAEKFLSSLNLPKIVEEKVNAMDTKEVEKLVLSIMKKELSIVVNLGALIGFVLGIINLLF